MSYRPAHCSWLPVAVLIQHRHSSHSLVSVGGWKSTRKSYT